MLLQLPVGGICSAAAWGPWGLGAPRTVPKKTVNRFFLGKVYQFVAKIVEVWALGFHGSAGFQAMCHGVGVAAQSNEGARAIRRSDFPDSGSCLWVGK